MVMMSFYDDDGSSDECFYLGMRVKSISGLFVAVNFVYVLQTITVFHFLQQAAAALGVLTPPIHGRAQINSSAFCLMMIVVVGFC